MEDLECGDDHVGGCGGVVMDSDECGLCCAEFVGE